MKIEVVSEKTRAERRKPTYELHIDVQQPHYPSLGPQIPW